MNNKVEIRLSVIREQVKTMNRAELMKFYGLNKNQLTKLLKRTGLSPIIKRDFSKRDYDRFTLIEDNEIPSYSSPNTAIYAKTDMQDEGEVLEDEEVFNPKFEIEDEEN